MAGLSRAFKAIASLATAASAAASHVSDFGRAVSAMDSGRPAKPTRRGTRRAKEKATPVQLWTGGEGQAAQYKAKRRIHAARSSSIRKIQTLNRLLAAEQKGA